MTTAIICIFIAGYIMVAMESVTKINKAAISLIMAVLCWTLLYLGFGATPEHAEAFTKGLGETSEILFFLMGAMVIVEVVDTNGGFYPIRERLVSRTKTGILWKLTFATFFLSSVLDNMTTAIVMAMVVDKLVSDRKEKLYYASMIILASNSGGAFSPIGDVTTIMLWVKGNISTFGVIRSLFLPSLVSVILPAAILSFILKGELSIDKSRMRIQDDSERKTSSSKRLLIFWIGIGGLLLIPAFRFLTGLPPFMGILLVLSILWIVTEKHHSELSDVSVLLHKIDLSTILFFLGILTTVAALSETGILKALGIYLDRAFNGNPYMITGIIGYLSAVVDNVPLVASCMGMYDLSIYGKDDILWQLLAYSAGVGGSMLIIGSAAGVVVMGLQKISFGWYLKHFSWIAMLGYLAGMLTFSLTI